MSFCSHAPRESSDPAAVAAVAAVAAWGAAVAGTAVAAAGVAVGVAVATFGAGEASGPAAECLPKILLNQLSGLVPVFLATSMTCLDPGGRNDDQGMENDPQMSAAAACKGVEPTTTFAGSTTPYFEA